MPKIADKIQTDRAKLVSVRMTEEEHQHLTREAERIGMKLSSFLRVMALQRFPLQIQAGMDKNE